MPDEPSRDSTAEWMARLRIAFRKAITEDDMAALAKSLVERAKKGDAGAVKTLLQMLEPPPVKQQNVLIVKREGQKRKKVLALEGRNGSGKGAT